MPTAWACEYGMRNDCCKNFRSNNQRHGFLPVSTNLDEHGQPTVSAYCARMVTDRQIDELIGLCKGVIADGVLNQQEAEFLRDWLKSNRAAAKRWPGDVIYDRI